MKGGSVEPPSDFHPYDLQLLVFHGKTSRTDTRTHTHAHTLTARPKAALCGSGLWPLSAFGWRGGSRVRAAAPLATLGGASRPRGLPLASRAGTRALRRCPSRFASRAARTRPLARATLVASLLPPAPSLLSVACVRSLRAANGLARCRMGWRGVGAPPLFSPQGGQAAAERLWQAAFPFAQGREHRGATLACARTPCALSIFASHFLAFGCRGARRPRHLKGARHECRCSLRDPFRRIIVGVFWSRPRCRAPREGSWWRWGLFRAAARARFVTPIVARSGLARAPMGRSFGRAPRHSAACAPGPRPGLVRLQGPPPLVAVPLRGQRPLRPCRGRQGFGRAVAACGRAFLSAGAVLVVVVVVSLSADRSVIATRTLHFSSSSDEIPDRHSRPTTTPSFFSCSLRSHASASKEANKSETNVMPPPNFFSSPKILYCKGRSDFGSPQKLFQTFCQKLLRPRP